MSEPKRLTSGQPRFAFELHRLMFECAPAVPEPSRTAFEPKRADAEASEPMIEFGGAFLPHCES